MSGMRGIGMVVATSGVLLSLTACSRTSDGTIVSDLPMEMPGVSLAPAAPAYVPSWLKRKPPEAEAAPNFPPPPEVRKRQRRKAGPPVIKTGSGDIACENKKVDGRVRMVCR